MLSPVHVAVKVGRTSKSSGTNVSVDSVDFSCDGERDSYSDFCIKIEGRVTASLRHFEVKTTRIDIQVYIEPRPTTAWTDFATDRISTATFCMHVILRFAAMSGKRRSRSLADPDA